MMDLSDKGSGSEESTSPKSPKTCSDCQTTKTPLWRGGPAGPKSLCNACGIRYRKKRRALLGLNNKIEKKERSSTSSCSSSNSNSNNNSSSDQIKNNNKIGMSLKLRFLNLGRDVLLERSSSMDNKKRQRKLGEEEQAAVLLMALSCGSVCV